MPCREIRAGQGLNSWEQFAQLLAAAADLCLAPTLHAVVKPEPADGLSESDQDLILVLQARDADGRRWSERDLELEIYSSGDATHLMLAWLESKDQPLLWHGNHPVWMDGNTGLRCERPEGGEALEALARRVRSLL